jgi:hypothetical protein
VVQKYIERPLLYRHRKFDIRLWAYATYKNELFMAKEGILRVTSDEYSLNNENNFVHLTNICVQKHGDNYGKHEEGNIVSFQGLQAFLEEAYPDFKLSVKDHFLPRMRDIIIDTFLSARNSINPNRRKNCFEVFGYDFLIDEDFRIWLLEVNTNPYLGSPS